MSISGGQKPAVRIQANPTALASYGLNLEDLRTAVAAANVNQAKGNFDGPRQAYTIDANDQLLTAKEYEPLIVAYATARRSCCRMWPTSSTARRTSSRRPG